MEIVALNPDRREAKLVFEKPSGLGKVISQKIGKIRVICRKTSFIKKNFRKEHRRNPSLGLCRVTGVTDTPSTRDTQCCF